MAAQDVQIRFKGDTRNLDRALSRVNRGLDRLERNAKQSQAALRGIQASAGRVSAALTAAGVAFAGFVAGRGISGILNATQQMEGFRTQLTTYLGSQQLANAELKRLSDLSDSLTQDVNELTEAFVIFNRFGLDTSNESMRAFSNIAAANSKSITQLGEAVADALTGEFERLKEFGIKVSKENGKFTARIGEDQVAVATTTSDLVEQLKALGEEGGRFGNVTIGPLTLAMSNFRGAIFKASAALGQGGLGLAISDTLNGMTELLTKNKQAVEAIGDGLTKAFLYAKEAGLFLFNNIELIAKALGILMGIAVARWAIGVATAFTSLAIAISGGAIKAFLMLAKVLKATALLAVRHPLIGAVAVVIGGIEYLTGAVSGLAEKLGLIGEDSALDALVTEAGELADTISGPIVDGIEDFKNISSNVDEQFASIKTRADEINQTLDETETTQKLQEIALQNQQAAYDSIRDQVADIINEKREELRVLGLTVDEQKLYNLEKEITEKLGQSITDSERAQLRQLILQTKEVERQNAIRQRTEAIADQIYRNSILGALEEQKALDGVMDKIREKYDTDVAYHQRSLGIIYDAEALFQLEIAQLKYDNAKAVDARIRDLELKRIRDMLEANKRGIATNLDEYDKSILQRIGQEERQQKIVDDRIEFEKKSEAEKWQWAISQGANAFEELGKYNKQAFEASKALRIAEAIMNTYQGATLALATYPPPFNFIGAAAVVAAGLANVATIRSQQYSGRQLGGAVSMGESYLVGETGPEIFTPGASGRIDRIEGGGGPPVEITFNINAVDAAGVDELLVNRRGTIQQIISDAMLERGQRSRF